MAAQHRTTRAKPISREHLAAFADEMFADLPRADQRHWARAYLEGLLTVRGRKSIRRVASVGSDSPTASRSLRHFINAGPWDWGPAAPGARPAQLAHHQKAGLRRVL